MVNLQLQELVDIGLLPLLQLPTYLLIVEIRIIPQSHMCIVRIHQVGLCLSNSRMRCLKVVILCNLLCGVCGCYSIL